MNWIKTSDLKKWVGTRDCQETLPLLLNKLIRATSNSITRIQFPSGDNIALGGWDGILEITNETEFLPSGISLWEIGTDFKERGKADKEYKKRCENPLGFNPSECTFIFVTPRLWTQSAKWINEKKKDKIWKDIRVINAVQLEEWLEVAPTVAAWLAIKKLEIYPAGIQSTEDFWEEWSISSKIVLQPKILLGGRNSDTLKTLELSSNPSITAIQGTSREEALAFTIACFKDNKDKTDDFFSRSLIVDSPEVFRQISIQTNPLILIPRFEDYGVLDRAFTKGHTVIVPVGGNSSESWGNKIILHPINKEIFIESLVESGLTKEIAEKHSKESARNINILRRRLNFDRNIPEWSKPENIREIIPALIVGRWDENYENDRLIISKFAGKTYEEYSQSLNKWLYTQDSPILRIGHEWRLISPLDAWINASKSLTLNDFELLKLAFHEVIGERNPAFDIESDKRHMASLYGKKRQYSTWIREGVIQSMILVSIYGDKLNLSKGEKWVDANISELLNSNDNELWKSFYGQLPLIAEASPTAFLNSLEEHLLKENSPIISLFDEEDGIITKHSYHTGLLWALESLAWLPKYFSRASLILAKLSAIDPGGSLSNRPINSLSEIFKSWHYQTLALFEDRMSVLKLISVKQNDVAWNLLIKLLPETHERATSTHKMRWRMFDEKVVIYTYSDVWKTTSIVIELLISIFDNTVIRVSQLLKSSSNIRISNEDREKLLSFILENIDKINHIENLAWKTIRGILSHHRSCPDADWSLSATQLIPYGNLYKILEPIDLIQKTKWLFEEQLPQLPDGFVFKEKSVDEKREIVEAMRLNALKNIHLQLGLEKIIEFSYKLSQTGILGNVLGSVLEDETEILTLCESIKTNQDEKYITFFHSFIWAKVYLNGIEWIFSLYDKLNHKGFNSTLLAQLFIPLLPSKRLWDFIDSTNLEIREIYWQKVNPYLVYLPIEERIMGLNNLIEFKRYKVAITCSSYFIEDVPTETIAVLLKKIAIGEINEYDNTDFDQYQIQQCFEVFNKRHDLDLQTHIELEWLYLQLLIDSGYEENREILLHEELAKNPDSFIEILKWIYSPKNEQLREVEMNGLSEEHLLNRAKNAYHLLNSWKKIPGVDLEGNIDEYFLNDWVDKVRKISSEIYHIEVADSIIGQILAEYPEQDIIWPPKEICRVIERINTQSIKTGFTCATLNKRRTTWRGIYDGGDIERENVIYFSKLSSNLNIIFPIVATILDDIARKYEDDVKRQDDDAKKSILEH